jgi:polar amino acid transport system substrate-binding protein
MKRFVAIILAGLMILSLAACGGKDDNVVKVGVLEADEIGMGKMATEEHRAHMKVDRNTPDDVTVKFVHYNNLSSALMDLESGNIKDLVVEDSAANYIAARNDKVAVTTGEITSYFSMMTMDSNKEVYDILNNAIKDMKADGTLDALIENELKAYIESDPVAKDLPHFDGARTIKIGVTGDLPPMDFVAANGKAAGFNIALLAEIANRAQVNIELVQIESGARAISLSSGKVDAVFWTRNSVCEVCGAEGAEKVDGTLVTESYYSDYTASITLKSDK